MVEKNQNVKEVVKGLHEQLKSKLSRNKENNTFILENQMLSLICRSNLNLKRVVRLLNEEYGQEVDEDFVIRLNARLKIKRNQDRYDLIDFARAQAELFVKAMQGNKKAYFEFKENNEKGYRDNEKHLLQERITIMAIYNYEDLFEEEDYSLVYLLGHTFCKYYYTEMLECVSNVYHYEEMDQLVQDELNDLTNDELKQKVQALQRALKRTNAMLQDLQDEYKDTLESSKIQEMVEFFSSLNSNKYGFILDEIFMLRDGVKQLRKDKTNIPLQLNGILIMVSKLIKFIQDNHIVPIMKVHEIKEVSLEDVEYCDYDGSPFENKNDKKKVKVVSPGWMYKDKQILISRAKLQEVE